MSTDHRQLGRELGLFRTDPLVGAGLPLWLPDGAISVASRNTPPMMNAPITANSTAFGAARRGLRVSSASVAAVSNP